VTAAPSPLGIAESDDEEEVSNSIGSLFAHLALIETYASADRSIMTSYIKAFVRNYQGKVIGSVSPSLHLFPLYLFNRLIFELEFLCVYGS